MADEHLMLEVAGRQVRLSNPDKVFFPEIGVTKLGLVEYYLAVADSALVHLRGRPTVMKRYVDGAAGEPFFQKRVPNGAPEWLETATISFPSGRTATELVPDDAAHLAWAVNLGVIDFNPWPVRRADLDRPDELRVDLDPMPDVPWDWVRRVALVVGDVLTDHGLVGFPRRRVHAASTSTCGSGPNTGLPKCVVPPWPWPARWSGAYPSIRTMSEPPPP